MSQPPNPADSQGMLHSMLQRLKLQPGREGQPFPSSPVTSRSRSSQDGDVGASGAEQLSNVNGFELSTNGITSNVRGTSAVEDNFVCKGGEIRELSDNHGTDKGLISSSSQRDDIENGTGGNRISGEATQSNNTLITTGGLFPAASAKGCDVTSFNGTNGEMETFGSPAMPRHISGDKSTFTNSGEIKMREQDMDRDFTPKAYTWAFNSTQTDVDPRSQDNKVLHVGNGGVGVLRESKDEQFAKVNSLRRGQHIFEKKTKKWTHKIKERWRDRPGSFGKKDKERREYQTVEQEVPEVESTTESIASGSSAEQEKTVLSSDSRGLRESQREEDLRDERLRLSYSNFDLGLGSFSLLEEIVTGQEWAKFLNPSLPGTTASQGPPEERESQIKSPPISYNSSPSPLTASQQCGGSSQFSSSTAKPSTVPYSFSSAQEQPGAPQTVNMDVSDRKPQEQKDVHAASDQSEPMEDEQSGERGRRQQQHTPPAVAEPAGGVVNSALRKVHLSRKRQYASAEATETSSLDVTHISTTNEMQQDVCMSANATNSPSSPVFSPPPFKPFAPTPRGVLKHSISVESQSSMETETKRGQTDQQSREEKSNSLDAQGEMSEQTKRRVEENRRVRFCEMVVSIDPPDYDMSAADFEEEEDEEEEPDDEEDSEEDNDSVVTQESEAMAEQPVKSGTSSSGRRAALPAWIKALKRKNPGRKRSYKL